MKKKLQNAYVMLDYADAKRSLERLHRELMDLNPTRHAVWKKGWKKPSRFTSYVCPINSDARFVVPM